MMVIVCLCLCVFMPITVGNHITNLHVFCMLFVTVARSSLPLWRCNTLSLRSFLQVTLRFPILGPMAA